jgi:hypothetical protein
MKTVEVGVVIYVPEYRGIKSSTIPIFREKPTVIIVHACQLSVPNWCLVLRLTVIQVDIQ